MSTAYQFINGEERDAHLEGLARVNASAYPFKSRLKLWPGLVLAVVSTSGQRPMILHRIRVSNLFIDEWGIGCQMFEMVTGQIFRCGHVPAQLFDTDILLKFPATTQVERTVKRLSGSKSSYGTTALALAMNRNDHETRRHHVSPWHEVYPDFFDTKEERTEAGLFYYKNAFEFQEG